MFTPSPREEGSTNPAPEINIKKAQQSSKSDGEFKIPPSTSSAGLPETGLTSHHKHTFRQCAATPTGGENKQLVC